MSRIQRISPCLWFDHQAETAARFYLSVFSGSRITAISRYGEAGHELHGKAAGSVMTVAFELEGQAFTALNGGPLFQFSPAISLQVLCDDQAEIDHYWQRLSEGGDAQAQQCGWLADRFGVSWQVVPRVLSQWLSEDNATRNERIISAMLGMRKLDLAALQHAHDSD